MFFEHDVVAEKRMNLSQYRQATSVTDTINLARLLGGLRSGGLMVLDGKCTERIQMRKVDLP